jgi:DNA-binding PadR family transcriptional regulator
LALGGVRGRKVLPFVGREQDLNRLVFEILRAKNLTSYETYQELHFAKGFRHIKNQVIDSRFDALAKESWIIPVGTKKNKFNQDMTIYQLSPKALDAMELDKVDLIDFQQEAEDDLQLKMSEVLAEFRKRKRAKGQGKN